MVVYSDSVSSRTDEYLKRGSGYLFQTPVAVFVHLLIIQAEVPSMAQPWGDGPALGCLQCATTGRIAQRVPGNPDYRNGY